MTFDTSEGVASLTFDTSEGVASLTFDTSEGVATSIQGNPLALAHAAPYVSAVSEAGTGAMLLAGLLSTSWLALRRRV